MALLITDDDVDQLYAFEDAIAVAEDIFRQAGERTAINPPRFRMPLDGGFLQFGPAALMEKKIVGYKVWTNFDLELKNTPAQCWNYIHSMTSNELIAILQAYRVGRFRTSAVTAVAVKHLSPAAADTLGLYVAGRHAEAQLAAVSKVRKLRYAKVYSRTADKREAFAHRMSQQLGIEVIPVSTPQEACRDTAIVVCMTNSDTPVLYGDWLSKPCLVVAAGANHWFKREIDGNVVRKADLVVVDDKAQSMVESGDLLWAVDHGITDWSRVENMGDVVVGRSVIPNLDSSLVLFESHGLAIHDVGASLHVYNKAKARGLGREITL
jgi:ornithine cyclodeaminase/alanine dehydrogenase-like protein (mu-crystallin family)